MIRGFEQKIENKIFNFWSHIRIFPLTAHSSTVTDRPITVTSADYDLIKSNSEIKQITPVANKAVIIKSRENIEGLILKGIDLSDSLLQYNLSNPKNIEYLGNEIPLILSLNSLDKLNTKIGSTVYIHTIDSAPHIVKGKIINSYYTNIEEFDNQFAISDFRKIQNLNHWNLDQISWIELFIKDIKNVQAVGQDLYTKLKDVNVETIFNLYPQMFDWLALMKRNELIILIVMQIVAIINIISTISIFILEKTQLIGILKVLGARNNDLYKMLYYQIGVIILKGILWGNLLTVLLTAILHYFKPIKLDPTIYYINYAPVAIDFKMWVSINLITILVCFLAAWIPLFSISKISPVKIAEYK